MNPPEPHLNVVGMLVFLTLWLGIPSLLVLLSWLLGDQPDEQKEEREDEGEW